MSNQYLNTLIKTLITSMLCLVFCQIYAQKVPQEIEFVRAVIGPKASLVYSDSQTNAVSDIRRSLTNDVVIPKLLVLTKADRQEIDAQLKDIKSSRWPADLFEHGKMISADTIKKIFDDKVTDGWQYFYQKYGQNLYNFSKPIFLRQGTFCIFYHDYGCGWLCASGELSIYQKVNGQWQKIRVMFTMIS